MYPSVQGAYKNSDMYMYVIHNTPEIRGLSGVAERIEKIPFIRGGINVKKEYKILLATGIIPFAVNIILLPFLPREIPMHYNSLGEVDRIGSKFEVLIFPVVILLITLFWIIVMKYYKNKTSKLNSEKDIENAVLICRMGILLNIIYNLMNIHFLAISMNTFSGKSLYIMSGIVVAAILIGSGLLTKNSKRNSFFGVRTKWSLHDDYCWDRTNSLGSKLLVLSGIFIAVILFVNVLNKFLIIMFILTLLVLILTIYSYYVYKTRDASKEERK